MWSDKTLEEILVSLEKTDLQKVEIASAQDVKLARDEIQRRLLRQTTKFSYETIPYYRKLFNNIGLKPGDIRNESDLIKIPILRKDDIKRNLADLISRTVNVVSMKRTSGTTDYPLPIYLSSEEIRARELLNMIVLRLAGQERRLFLRIEFLRGVMAQTPKTPFFMINIPYMLDDPYRVVFLMDELLREHSIFDKDDKISVMSLPVPWVIEQITDDLEKIKVDPKKLGIKLIACSGGSVTRHLREFVKEKWNAEIIGGYSMAEVCGNAVECPLSSMHHFDLTVIPEVLDFDSGERVSYGEEGILTLTTLYPFQQAMPLLRYWTDDIVMLTDDECECGFNGISIKKLIGRKEYCIDLRKVLAGHIKPKFLSYLDVLEVVDDIPETNPRQIKIKHLSRAGKCIIKISVVLNHEITKARATEISERIKQHIKKVYREWVEFFDDDKIKISVELLRSFYVIRSRGGFFRT